jgi:hypothetical protein
VFCVCVCVCVSEWVSERTSEWIQACGIKNQGHSHLCHIAVTLVIVISYFILLASGCVDFFFCILCLVTLQLVGLHGLSLFMSDLFQ